MTTAKSLGEIKTLVTEIKDNMLNEKDCNDQLYTIIQTLDGIGNYMQRMESGESPKSEEYTVLQANILELRNEFAKLNKNFDGVVISELKKLITNLVKKFDAAKIPLDPMEAFDSAKLEENISKQFSDNALNLSSKMDSSANLIKKDLETLNENLKDGIAHLEKTLKSGSGSTSGSDTSIQSLSDDLMVLSADIKKSNDNLKRSVIDIFSRIQEGITGAVPLTNTVEEIEPDVNFDQLLENLEMLKNGLYNVNQNTNEQFAKLENILSELTPLTSGLSELSEKSDLKNDKIDSLSDKIESIVPETQKSFDDIKSAFEELKKSLATLQSGDEESDYTYSMQDIESDIAKIRISMNELKTVVDDISKNTLSDELNNIYITLDAVNQKISKNENYKMTENIQKIADDILSISTRVNTLLLSSEKDSETLKTSLDEFNTRFEQINDELRSQSNIEQYNALLDALSRIDTNINENKNYNDLINQSLVMLAEWVDNAGETLTDIDEKLGEGISSIKIPEPIDYTSHINALEKRIAQQNEQILQQQEYIQSIDEKLATLLAQNERIALQEEKLRQMDERMTTILEFTVKNDGSAVIDKMAGIDMKLEKLNSSIGKLTSYVDEE